MRGKAKLHIQACMTHLLIVPHCLSAATALRGDLRIQAEKYLSNRLVGGPQWTENAS